MSKRIFALTLIWKEKWIDFVQDFLSALWRKSGNYGAREKNYRQIFSYSYSIGYATLIYPKGTFKRPWKVVPFKSNGNRNVLKYSPNSSLYSLNITHFVVFHYPCAITVHEVQVKGTKTIVLQFMALFPIMLHHSVSAELQYIWIDIY